MITSHCNKTCYNGQLHFSMFCQWVFQKIVTIDVHNPGVPNSKDYAGFQAGKEQRGTQIDCSYRNSVLYTLTKGF